jgi:hypothetical protein
MSVYQSCISGIKRIKNALFHCQVVTLAVYSYFITCIMGRQWVEGIDENLQKQRNSIDLYFPIFTMLQVSIFKTQKKYIVFLTLGAESTRSLCGCGGSRLQSITP